MSQKFPMTPRCHERMKVELKKLKEVDRPANSKAIEIARAHGDLSENADYDAAKNEQGMIEARVKELEVKIALAEVIDPGNDFESLVVNTTAGVQSIKDSKSLRRAALINNLPYFTTTRAAKAGLEAISARRRDGVRVAPLQHYHRSTN